VLSLYFIKSNHFSLFLPAMSLLGEFLAPLLDIIYRSDEKDKVVPLLSSLLQVVMPYLRTHSKGNVAW